MRAASDIRGASLRQGMPPAGAVRCRVCRGHIRRSGGEDAHQAFLFRGRSHPHDHRPGYGIVLQGAALKVGGAEKLKLLRRDPGDDHTARGMQVGQGDLQKVLSVLALRQYGLRNAHPFRPADIQLGHLAHRQIAVVLDLAQGLLGVYLAAGEALQKHSQLVLHVL